MNAAEGVTTIDSTDLDFDQTIQAVVDLVQRTRVNANRRWLSAREGTETQRTSTWQTTIRTTSRQLDEQLAERLAAITDDEAIIRANALRAGLTDYELDDEDLDILESVGDDPDAVVYLPGVAGARDRRPPERRQVGPREPHPRPPRGRRGRHPRRHP
jgi:hypothetical protein